MSKALKLLQSRLEIKALGELSIATLEQNQDLLPIRLSINLSTPCGC